MKNREEIKRELIERIDALVQESCTLRRTPESWGRHVEIQAEIMQLCRRTADLFAGRDPYWMDEPKEPASDATAPATPQTHRAA